MCFCMGNVGNVIQTRNVSSLKLRVDYGFSKCANFLYKLIFCYLLLVSFKFYQLPARKLIIKHQNCTLLNKQKKGTHL